MYDIASHVTIVGVEVAVDIDISIIMLIGEIHVAIRNGRITFCIIVYMVVDVAHNATYC